MAIKSDELNFSYSSYLSPDNSLAEFVQLLNSKNVQVQELQTYAHNLLESGIAFTTINASAYPYFETALFRKGEELERAKAIADCFTGKPFYWNCWIK